MASLEAPGVYISQKWPQPFSFAITPEKNRLSTGDGRYPAPPGMHKTLKIMGQTTYQLVQDFFHQQYD